MEFYYFSVMKTEMARQGALDGVAKFDPNALKNVETQEKNPLPDKDGTKNTLHFANLLQFSLHFPDFFSHYSNLWTHLEFMALQHATQIRKKKFYKLSNLNLFRFFPRFT